MERDIVFVLEDSSSVSASQFQSTKTFLSSLVNNLALGDSNSRYAVIQYSSYTSLLDFNQDPDLIQEISRLNEPYSAPRVGLKMAREYLETQGRQTSEKIVMLIGSDVPNYPCSCDDCLSVDNGCGASTREISIVGNSGCTLEDSYLIPTCKTQTTNCSTCNITSASMGGCMTCANPIHEVNLMREFGWHVVSFGIVNNVTSNVELFQSVLQSINYNQQFLATTIEMLNDFPMANLTNVLCMKGPLPSFVILPPPVRIADLRFADFFSNTSAVQISAPTGNPPQVTVALSETVTLLDYTDVVPVFETSHKLQDSYQIKIEMDSQTQIVIQSNSSSLSDLLEPLQSIAIKVEQQNLNFETFSGVNLPSFYDVVDPNSKQPIGQVVGTGYNAFSFAGSSLITSINQVSVCVQMIASSKVRSPAFVSPQFVKRVDTNQKKGTQTIYEFTPYSSAEATMTGVQNQRMCGRVNVSFGVRNELIVFPALVQQVGPQTSQMVSPASSLLVPMCSLLLLALVL